MKTVPYTREAVAAKLLDQPAYDKFTREHIGILLSLPEREQDAVLEQVRAIANSIPGMGAVAAFELVVRLGRLLAKEAPNG